jgi:hypothetical protein
MTQYAATIIRAIRENNKNGARLANQLVRQCKRKSGDDWLTGFKRSHGGETWRPCALRVVHSPTLLLCGGSWHLERKIHLFSLALASPIPWNVRLNLSTSSCDAYCIPDIAEDYEST